MEAETARRGRFLLCVRDNAACQNSRMATKPPRALCEGIYVIPRARKRCVARALLRAAERWSAAAGCREMASDALLGNRLGHAFHRAAGFTESDRVVYFVKRIGKPR
jgi:aminoglycoside 6'-N-acetyltransferase I